MVSTTSLVVLGGCLGYVGSLLGQGTILWALQALEEGIVSHLPKQFTADMLQLLNVALQERVEGLTKATESKGFFIHSPDRDHYEVRSLEGPIAVFSLTELPGCCGAIVSYHSEVVQKYQKQGVGRILLDVRMDAARNRGYGQMIATVLDTNPAEKQLLLASGWVKAKEFRNPKTGNIVGTYTVNL